MQTSQIEILNTRPGFVLAEIAETAEGVSLIGKAHQVLMQSHAEVLRVNDERRKRQALGVSIPACELADWHLWQGTVLREFHKIRIAAAECVLPLFDQLLAAEGAGRRDREVGLERGLAKLLDDDRVGADVALLLRRITGGLPVNEDLLDTRNRWRNLANESRRALVELPLPPVHKPSATENATELQQMINEGNIT
ncbi:MAG: hypothetical protein WCL16_07285 [bacterium]